MKKINITAAEMEIMQAVWQSDGPITSHEIMEKLPGKKLTTIVTLAGRLIDKGALTSEKVGRSHAHRYSAAISEDEYKRMQTHDFLSSVHKGSAKSLISALFDGDDLTKEDLAELREYIDNEVDKDV